LEHLFESIDEHFGSVEYVNKLHSELELHGKRFRAVQKRLLVRFKDRRPEPLGHLEALLDDTYDKIIDCCTQIDESTSAVHERGRDLVHNCHLFLTLLQCQFNLTEEGVSFLRKFISPQVEHNQGGYTWEEYTESSLSYLLKAHLSKSQKDTITFGGISKITGTAKLKKLLSTVCERFSRGIQLRIT
jgi:Bardet-Biedl syndrome 9 protein